MSNKLAKILAMFAAVVGCTDDKLYVQYTKPVKTKSKLRE